MWKTCFWFLCCFNNHLGKFILRSCFHMYREMTFRGTRSHSSSSQGFVAWVDVTTKNDKPVYLATFYPRISTLFHNNCRTNPSNKWTRNKVQYASTSDDVCRLYPLRTNPTTTPISLILLIEVRPTFPINYLYCWINLYFMLWCHSNDSYLCCYSEAESKWSLNGIPFGSN